MDFALEHCIRTFEGCGRGHGLKFFARAYCVSNSSVSNFEWFCALMLCPHVEHTYCALMLCTYVVPSCCACMLCPHVAHACCALMLRMHVVPSCCACMLCPHVAHACCALMCPHVVPSCCACMLCLHTVPVKFDTNHTP